MSDHQISTANNYIPTTSEKFFALLQKTVFSKDVNSFFGIVDEYKEDDMPGSIWFKVPGLHNKTKNNLFAQPKNPNMYVNPIVGSIVKIERIQGYYFYSSLYKHTNTDGIDIVSNTLLKSDLSIEEEPDKTNYETSFSQTSQTPTTSATTEDFPQLQPVVEKPGDVHIRGLFNNNIILTYDENKKGNISLIVNRDDELFDANTDGIHIYSESNIDSILDSFVSNKTNVPQEDNTSGTIVINSGKIRILSTNGSALVGSTNNINFIADNNITLDANEKILTDAKEIILGKNATELLVLGNKLTNWLNELIDALLKLTVGTAVGPSTVPINAASFTSLKTKINSILSKQNKTL